MCNYNMLGDDCMRGKIGILTINDYSNYGNRLQNYALQEVLKSFDYEVETIVQDRPVLSGRSRSIIMKIKDFIISSKGNRLQSIKSRIQSKMYSQVRKEKISNLRSFTSKYINEASVRISINDIPEFVAQEYTFFVTGSDQVWNPNFGFANSIDFLEFAPTSKRIAYAPSFGVSNLPQELEDNFRSYLQQIDHLSVRENTGAVIIEDLIGINVPVLVDPTLLLDKKKWKSITQVDINKPNQEYLLTYILGEIPPDVKEAINLLSKKYNLKLVNLADLKDSKRYVVGPAEFLDYINSAKLIITNSFHGAVFSILFERPFIVADRLGNSPSMNSRIDTLLKKLNLLDRKWEMVKKSKEYFNSDFSNTPRLLEYERNKALMFLKKALNIRDNK